MFMRIRAWVCLAVLAVAFCAGWNPAGSSSAYAQVNTAELVVRVLDQTDAAIVGAAITVKNIATNAERKLSTGDTGSALFVALPPGTYEVTVEAQGFKKLVNPHLVLTIGQAAEFSAKMVIASGSDVVVVTTETELIETRRTSSAATVDQRAIENLPLNSRNYLNIALTDSSLNRDSSPSIGAAPTSGINFGGQRARSNQVSVDGSDATDNSVNGVRSTVPMEAVQEFQLIKSNYMPEFGRATGGVVNIVTKGGGNDVHGNVFGFLRHKNIQARNPFSVEIDPATNQPVAVKQGFTRFQGGATIGGPIQKDKTWYFFAFETTQRQETGFTDIGRNNFDFVTVTSADTPLVPAGLSLLMTPAQRTFVVSGSASAAARQVFALLAGASSNVALDRDMGVPIATALVGLGFPAGPGGTDSFPLPVSGVGRVALPASYVGLNSLRGNYPFSEDTWLWSARLDHQWNSNHISFLRVNVAPSKVTGVQVNAQNQNFGQNAGSRTSLNQTRDLAVVGQHVTLGLFGTSFQNEARFQFARRGLHYGFSELAGGSGVGVNITGYAFFGREPFSTVDRIERRWQWQDSVTWTKGRHQFKFGGDVNLIQLRSKKTQIFELNFGGIYNFGSVGSGPILTSILGSAITGTPDFTPVQAYGLGIPTVFIQGIGTSDVPFDNKAFAFFVQDSWQVHPRFTVNYGVRYDVELIPTFSSSTPLNAAAEQSLGIVLGIPHDKNNWSPRFGFAWDPWGDKTTLIRAGYGVFFDHPLLAVAFNSVTADGARSTQLLSAGGSASAAAVTPANAATVLNAASIFQGVLNVPANFGYLAAEQRFDPKLPNSIFVNQNFLSPTSPTPIPLLPFTLHVDEDFKYGYTQQANFAVERTFAKDYVISVSYNYTHGVNLNRPRNITPPDGGRLVRNWRNFFAVNLPTGTAPSSPVTTSAPSAAIVATAGTCAYTPVVPGVLGLLSGCPAAGPNAGLDGQFLSTAAVFNFFRPTGPNPSFAPLFPGGYGTPTTAGSQVFFAALAGYPTGVDGVPVAFSDVVQQESSGNSVYHGMTFSFSKRFSGNIQFLTSWTWSHAIDDSTDLQTLLAPQDNNRPDLERGNSTFDQRHRWVTSAILQSPYKIKSASGAWQVIMADWTFSPLMEYSTGRPFTVLTGTDFNLDFGSNTDRPSQLSTGGVPSLFLPQANTFVPGTRCPNDPLTGNPTSTIFTGLPLPTFFGCTGDLGRNTFRRPKYFSFDFRVSRRFPIGERWSIEFMMDLFNSTNKFNVADVSPLCNPLASCRAGEPTAALDPRQLQFGLKINW
jgi:hypothetical protein